VLETVAGHEALLGQALHALAEGLALVRGGAQDVLEHERRAAPLAPADGDLELANEADDVVLPERVRLGGGGELGGEAAGRVGGRVEVSVR
jgi:hypothetical protein